MNLYGEGLDWTRDGADWPNREASRFVEAGGLRWHVQVMGQGPQLVLVHGTGASTHSWRALAPLLARRFNVVAMDLPSHAFTGAPAFRELSLDGMAGLVGALLDRMDVRPVVAAGHSAGAAILARMCLDGAMEPRRLISLNGALLPFGGVGRHLFPALASLMFTNPLTARLVALRASEARVRSLLEGTGSRIDEEGLRLYTRLFSNPLHVSGALRMMANWRLDRMEAGLAGLKPELLLVAGDRDRAIPIAQAEHLQTLIPGARLMRLQGLGHLAHEQDPASVGEAILSFCAQEQGLYPPAKGLT